MPLLPSEGLLPSPDLLPDAPVYVVEITDLYGTVLYGPVAQYSGTSVEYGISADRVASITFSLYNPAVEHLKLVNEGGKVIATLARMIRIKYRGSTENGIWGLVVAPKYSTSQKAVTVGIQGPTYKLRHRQLNLGDDVVGTEDNPVHNPADHSTMKAIVEAAYDTRSQYAQNIPDIGVLVENVSGKDAPEAFWTDVQRGSNNYDKLVEVGDGPYGGEWDVVPYDPTPDELPFDTTLIEVTEP